jgi:hypothetical protein
VSNAPVLMLRAERSGFARVDYTGSVYASKVATDARIAVEHRLLTLGLTLLEITGLCSKIDAMTSCRCSPSSKRRQIHLPPVPQMIPVS